MKPPAKSPTVRRRLALGSLVIGVALLPDIARGATPCASDIEKLCAKVPVGGGQIQACLKEHEAIMGADPASAAPERLHVLP
jgi:hypothetical protein